MHDEEKMVIHLTDDWELCPGWWRNMVRHLSSRYQGGWAEPIAGQIISDYLRLTYGAKYHAYPDFMEETKVEFETHASYIECVLHWS